MSEQRFDPVKHLITIKGKGEYLPVKFRLLWLRTVHPDAAIETQLVELGEGFVLFKARVSIPGGGSATGYGSETAADVPEDWIERGETKAIGRALAALGYGTQSCPDHDLEAVPAGAAYRVVDAPVQRGQVAGGEQPATERQLNFMRRIAREVGVDEAELAAWSQELYSQDVDELNRRDASALIEALQRRRNEVV